MGRYFNTLFSKRYELLFLVVDCLLPPNTTNSSYNLTSSTYDSTVTYSCGVNMRFLNGETQYDARCQDDASWNVKYQSCYGSFVLSYFNIILTIKKLTNFVHKDSRNK